MDDAFDQLLLAIFQAFGAGAIFGVSFAPLVPVLKGLILRRFTFAQLGAVPKYYMVFIALGVSLAALGWCIAIGGRDWPPHVCGQARRS